MANESTAILSRLDGLIPRRMPSRRWLGFAAYTVALFIIFLLLTFPHDLIARGTAERFAEQSGIQLRFDEAWLAPWDGYRFSNVRIVGEGDAEPWLGVPKLSLRPSLRALFGGDLSGATFHGEAYGGEFWGWMQRGERTTAKIEWDGIELARYPWLDGLVEGEWRGILSGDIDLTLGEGVRDAEGRGKIALRDGSLTAGNARGFTVPDLTAMRGDAELEIKGGRLEISSMKLTGAEIDADLRGQVYLRAPVADSVVNATLTVKPVPGAPSGIEGLLMLGNRGQRAPSGTYSLRLYGMLTRLKVS